ncbi:hypothetical protein DRH27_01890 [Candidatus Falkowbacteria bacterium]|nr:MAG: hypothetical protein DRH27_01890 [Candidatus Falkowbacteria bacterium]
MKNKLFFVIIIIFVLIFSIFAYVFITGKGQKNYMDSETQDKMRKITLNYWRVWDDSDDFKEIIDKYQRLHPNIKIEYRKLRYDEYENELLEAFATDRGPDILSIHNTWTKSYQERGLLEPMPAEITMVFPQIKGNLKKEVVYNKQTTKSLSLNTIKNGFADVVYQDAVIDTKDDEAETVKKEVYGLPLSIDTLVLYYNKDLFNNAGISNPPVYWDKEFQQDVKKLTKQNNKGQIVQSGTALGGSGNIERSTDILSILMMQNGTVMMEDNHVKFHQNPESANNKSYNPGLDALRFYTDFSNPAKEVYSWNNSLENSLELFIQGKLAMMFGYSYMLEQIQARAPKLNFSITGLPQIEGNPQRNFANYWVEAVSRKSEAPEEAWDFIQFMIKKDQVRSYLEKTKKPTALRSLVDEQIEDEDVSVFAQQVLTAESWYQGHDSSAAEAIIKEMVDDAIQGQNTLENIISLAAKKVEQTINK